MTSLWHHNAQSYRGGVSLLVNGAMLLLFEVKKYFFCINAHSPVHHNFCRNGIIRISSNITNV